MAIYDEHKEAFDHLASIGFPSIVEVAKLTATRGELALAVGCSEEGGAVRHWLVRGSPPTKSREMIAKAWLNARAAPEPEKDDDVSEMVIVIIPKKIRPKIERILSLMNCEFVEI